MYNKFETAFKLSRSIKKDMESLDSGFGSNEIHNYNIENSLQEKRKLNASISDNVINDIHLDLNSLIKTAEESQERTLKDTQQIDQIISEFSFGVDKLVTKTAARIKSECTSIALSDHTNMVEVCRRLSNVKTIVNILQTDVAAARELQSYDNLPELGQNLNKQRSILSVTKNLLNKQNEHSIEIVPNRQMLLNFLSTLFEELKVKKVKLGTKSTDLILPSNLGIKDKILHEKVVIDVYGDVRISELRGCTILSVLRQLILTDYRNCRLICYRTDGVFHRSIAVKAQPFGVTEVGTHVIAVSFPDTKCVQIIDIKDDQDCICDEYFFEGRCFGLSCYHEKLAVRIEDTSFSVVNLFSGKTTDIKAEMVQAPYISYVDGKILYTNWKNGKVCCCDEVGNVIWSFQNDILGAPNGISTDSYGNVYVTGHNSDNIIYFSKDGLHVKKMLIYKGNLCKPLALHYNTYDDELLVTSHKGIVVLYKVKNV